MAMNLRYYDEEPYEYFSPPGSLIKICNPQWLGNTASISARGLKDNVAEMAAVGKKEYSRTFFPSSGIIWVRSDRPLLVEWYLVVDKVWYTGQASWGLHQGTVSGRWASGGDWDTTILTIQDRHNPQSPGYANRPIQVYNHYGAAYGPSQVMEVGDHTYHRLNEWRELKDGFWDPNDPAPRATGHWIYDFEGIRGAAWSLVRHASASVDVKLARPVEHEDREVET